MYSILHVDNSGFFKKILKEAFTAKGCNYIPVSTVDGAFEVLGRDKVDLIITAIELENGNGEDLLRRINASDFDSVPVVVISSYDTIEIREKMFLLGAIDFIPKDISYDRLLMYVDKLTRQDVIEYRLKEMKIAVLDDSITALNLIKNILTLNGIQLVDYFSSTEDFLKSDREYDIYILDVILPKYSGEHLVYEIRRKYPQAVIIAVSAIEHYKTIANIFLSGADDYIMKPFNAGIFMARIKANVRTFLLMRELEDKNRELAGMVVRDGLTKIYNHRYIFERLETEIHEAQRYGKRLSVIMFDIDNFKTINDSFGHQTGDSVLVDVASALLANFRDVDIVGRYGGEEFAVILPETDLASGKLSAERARQSVEKLMFGMKGIKITVSGGVAEYENEDALRLLRKADELLYAAKQNGKNRIE